MFSSVWRAVEIARIYWAGDDTRMAPPPSFPHAFGVTGPCTVNMNPRKKVVINDVESSVPVSNETEMTTVDETVVTTSDTERPFLPQ